MMMTLMIVKMMLLMIMIMMMMKMKMKMTIISVVLPGLSRGLLASRQVWGKLLSALQ